VVHFLADELAGLGAGRLAFVLVLLRSRQGISFLHELSR
jgi:hypothetical protein